MKPMKKDIRYLYSISTDVIEIKVKNLNRTIYKNSCPVHDKKKIKKIFFDLQYKGLVDLSLLFEKDMRERGWFD